MDTSSNQPGPGARAEPDPLSEIGPTPHLALGWEPARRALHVRFDARPRPCFTPELVASVHAVGRGLRSLRAATPWPAPPPVAFVVLGSTDPEVFSAGGDLTLFADAIERGDRAAIEGYGRVGTAALHALTEGFGADAVTVAAVDGRALGGGFEAARCCDLLVATERSTFALPEAAFGLHPGNGAMSVMARRAGFGTMRRLMLEGVRLTAAEASERGLVDVVVATGGDLAGAVAEVLDATLPRHAAALALHRGWHESGGLTLERMQAETARWARAAASLDERGVTAMRRIVGAQDRMAARAARRAAPDGVRSCL